jgi:hypothetical protein
MMDVKLLHQIKKFMNMLNRVVILTFIKSRHHILPFINKRHMMWIIIYGWKLSGENLLAMIAFIAI